jgi:hypothetical protein
MEYSLDNKYTLLYKLVKELRSPIRYIVNLEDKWHSFEEIVVGNPEVDLLELIDLFLDPVGKVMDIIYAFFYYNLRTRDAQSLYEYINSILEYINQTNKIENPDFRNLQLFDSLNDLKMSTKQWQREYIQEYQRDLQESINVEKIKAELIKIQPLEYNSLTEKSAEYIFTPVISLESEKNKRQQQVDVNEKIGIMIINESKASITVPLIKLYNYDNKEYFKVYESDMFRNIDKIVSNVKFDKNNCLYFLVLNDDSYNTINFTSYTEVKYDLVNNKLSFECEYQKEGIVLRRLQTCFNGFYFPLENSIKQNIKATLIYPDISINPAVLHFLFFNEKDIISELPIFNTYFFLSEEDLTIAERENPIIKFRSLSSKQLDEEAINSDASIKFIQVDSKILVEITKAVSTEIVIKLIYILSRILNYYLDVEETILDNIENVVPSETSGVKKKRQRQKISSDVFEKKIDQLRELSADPEIFKASSEGYSRHCNCQKQPIIIEEEEFEDWKNKTFIDKGQVTERQIGNFPPNVDEPIFNYVCPDDKIPYPTVIEIKDQPGKTYPYLPCCAKTDSINNPKSDYNLYGSDKKESIVNRSYKPKAKILEWKRTGELTASITDILNAGTLEKNIYERFGTGDSMNSFIHCILIAKNVKKYKDFFTSNNYKECENYCNEIRKSIPSLVPNFYELTRQETFTETKETLLEGILDNKKYFDSSLYYRIFEEMYNINIFIFDSTSKMEIPNHALVHIRPSDEKRKTIILYKNVDSDNEKYRYPVYDIIINTNIIVGKEKSSAPYTFLHNSDIGKIVYTAFQKHIESYTFSIVDNAIQSRFNPYSVINWLTIFNQVNIVSQEIDIYGKVRSFNINFKDIDALLTVCVPPSQPLNIPLTENFNRISREIVEGIFGIPNIRTKYGMWYKILDFENGVFIPASNPDVDNTEPISPIIEQITLTDNPIFDYRKVSKYSKLLLDFIIWGLRSNNIRNLKDFIDNKDKYILLNKKIKANIPPIKLISYISGKGDFSYLASIWPEYFYNNNTVQLYESLYEKVILYLNRYYTITDGLDLQPDPYIKGIYEYEWDFKKYTQNRMLISKEHLNTWSNIHHKNFKGDLQIFNEIKPGYLKGKEPILYNNKETNRMYIVQMVKDDNKERALNCAEEWRMNKYNLGYETPKNLHTEISYIIFNISPTYSIFETNLAEIYDDNDTDYVCILEHNNNYYALLELF